MSRQSKPRERRNTHVLLVEDTQRIMDALRYQANAADQLSAIDRQYLRDLANKLNRARTYLR